MQSQEGRERVVLFTEFTMVKGYLLLFTAIRKSTQPQNGKISKQDQKAQQFDSKLSHLKDKVPAFLETCVAGSVEEDMTETIEKLKGILSEEDRVAVGKTFNREINLWQVKVKKKIPPFIKQGLHLKVTWNKCEETLTNCAKDAKADFINILDAMLKCIGEGDEAENNTEDEEVCIICVGFRSLQSPVKLC